MTEEQRREHKRTVPRFIISGGTSSALNLGVLFMLVDILGVWYLLASLIGYVSGTVSNFVLQKHYTFGDSGRERIGYKFSIFMANAGIDILLNLVSMYVLVDVFLMNHLLAQVFIIGVLAVKNYLLFRSVIFNTVDA